jgi:hypothetical protein
MGRARATRWKAGRTRGSPRRSEEIDVDGDEASLPDGEIVHLRAELREEPLMLRAPPGAYLSGW